MSAMVAVWWHALDSYFVIGGKPLNEKLSGRRSSSTSSSSMTSPPSTTCSWTGALELAQDREHELCMMHLAVLASMIHAFAVPASMEVALRHQGHTRGLFEWLKKAPWGNPAFSSIAISILLFGFLGGITGVIFGTEQFNIIRHNTIAITGHFHGTVVAGTTVAFMGFTYLLVPYVFRRELIWKGFASIQPYIYGVGVALLSIGMMSAGSFGVPRRHYDITFSGAPFSFSFDPSIDLFLSMMGVGACSRSLEGALH
ncbi:MAG: cbb3-type cytochrome c oxidase subunit I [Deltaproteobacteria bacterium]|nr:cbb3-type cytochrome c oxidase subunit I [Deltaproteobacteria bacterium]